MGHSPEASRRVVVVAVQWVCLLYSFGGAVVFGGATVSADAVVSSDIVLGDAIVFGNDIVFDNAVVSSHRAIHDLLTIRFFCPMGGYHT